MRGNELGAVHLEQGLALGDWLAGDVHVQALDVALELRRNGIHAALVGFHPPGGAHRRQVDRDRVGHVDRVAAAEGGRHRDIPLAAGGEHDLVPPLEPFQRQAETSELIVAVGIRAGLVEDQIGARLVEHLGHRRLDDLEVEGILDPRRPRPPAVERDQTDVPIARLLDGIVVVLVHRERVDRRVAAKDPRGAVPLVHVEVHDRHPRCPPFRLHRAGRNRQIVEVAEALRALLEGVMKPAAKVHRPPALQGRSRGQRGSAAGEPEEVRDLLGQGQLAGGRAPGVHCPVQVVEIRREMHSH